MCVSQVVWHAATSQPVTETDCLTKHIPHASASILSQATSLTTTTCAHQPSNAAILLQAQKEETSKASRLQADKAAAEAVLTQVCIHISSESPRSFIVLERVQGSQQAHKPAMSRQQAHKPAMSRL